MINTEFNKALSLDLKNLMAQDSMKGFRSGDQIPLDKHQIAFVTETITRSLSKTFGGASICRPFAKRILEDVTKQSTGKNVFPVPAEDQTFGAELYGRDAASLPLSA